MRTFTWSLHAAALATFTLAAAGCVIDVETHRDRDYYRDHPVYVERHYAYEYHPDRVVVVEQPPADQVVVATEAPPPVYAEVVPANTYGPDFIWIGGNWVISGGRWVWVHGHYDRRPRHDAVWVGGAWESHGGRYEFHAGHWR